MKKKARSRVPQPRQWMGARGEALVAIQVLLFGLVGAGPWLAAPLAQPSVWIRIPSGAMILLGGVIALGAIWQQGRHISALPHPADKAPLIQDGLYAWVRHPIYAAALLAALGWTLWTASAWTLLGTLLLVGLLEVKARREERLLAAQFPGYRKYQRRVKRFVPGLY